MTNENFEIIGMKNGKWQRENNPGTKYQVPTRSNSLTNSAILGDLVVSGSAPGLCPLPLARYNEPCPLVAAASP